jgi:uncharacterized protein YegP (UPF0339 family)
MGKFVISKRASGDFQFNLKSGNRQIILVSEGYSSKVACENGIESVKKNSQSDERYDRKESSNLNYFFNLKATNGQIIVNSGMYESIAARENGIESVKKNAPDVIVDYQSSQISFTKFQKSRV